MGYWLAKAGDAQQSATIKRFDPRYWSVNFPRPMMAGVTTIGPHSLRVDAVFYKANDLCGLIWDAEDRFDHPLLAYETARDFRGCALRFNWQSSGIMPLDAINGPTLTIEGRAQDGTPRTWFVRLWNYASGTPENAQISLNFDALDGGFAFPGDRDPVWSGDIDRMFISLVPPGYTAADLPFAGPAEGWVILADIVCDGPSSVLSIGDVLVPPHGLSIATGYDDSYNLTPERLLHAIFALGYRGSITHYVGMSHYFRLDDFAPNFYVSLTGGALNAPCAAWHADFCARAQAYGFSMIMSLSYELFDAHCWNDWKQRTYAGDPALTGWQPPSTLLSPANANAMGYLHAVARAFVQIAVAAGHAPRFQVGEPWWWITTDGRPCLYDDAAKALFGGNPVNIANVRSSTLSASKKALLDAAGAVLAASTAALVAAVRLDHPTCQSLILIYLPTVLDAAAPDLARANVPTGWAHPAFDVLQLEDYDWVTTGNTGASARGAQAASQRLNYDPAQQHYLSGFVLRPQERAQWALIDAAAQTGRSRGVAETFVWALPQVLRDGYTHFSEGDVEVQAFDDVVFPLEIGREARVSPGYSTTIVTTASGREQRNVNWATGRMRYDVGTGVRAEADLEMLITFFRARRGAAKGFLFHDPLDHSAVDAALGTGDGVQSTFPLFKTYGAGDDAERRRITRPLAQGMSIKINGVPQASGWALLAGGSISFDLPPAIGAILTASFAFHVPVRFAEDNLDVDCTTFAAGDAPSVPLIEIREA
jgi:uncharacterized protein (TIGR02217 family)